MKITGAVVEAAGGPFVFSELELDAPRADEVVVRIAAVGLCHTDLTFAGGRGLSFPLLLGHEGAGVVEEVGPAVASLAPGDHVVISFAWCGHCGSCFAGQPAYCRRFGVENMSGARPDGSVPVRRGGEPIGSNFFGQSSFATHSLCREQHLVKIDDDVPFEFAGPLGCGVQTGAGAVLNVLRPRPGTSVAVFGAGGVGLSGVLAAKACGAGPIVVVEPHASRRALALELGASFAFDPADPDLLSQLRAVTGTGFAHAMDTSGNRAMIRTAFEALDGRGSLVIMAIGADGTSDVSVPIAGFMGGRSIAGATEGSANPRLFIPQLLRMWRDGRFPIESLCRTFAIDQIAAAVEAMRSGEAIKPVLIFD